MRVTIVFEPEDGTGLFTKTYKLWSGAVETPDQLWYGLVKAMKEIIHTWQWSRAGKPEWTDAEKRLEWKAAARTWTAPIDNMIDATKEGKRG